MSNLITCPHCHRDFSLDDAQKHELEAMKIELEKKLQAEIKADSDKRALTWAQEQIAKARLESEENARKQSIELESLRKRDEEGRKKEEQFLRQQNEFEMLKKNLELEKDRARIEERKKLEEEFAKQTQDKLKLELEKQDLETDKKLRAKDEQIAQMQRAIEDAKRKGEQGSMQIQGEIQEDALKELLGHNFPIDNITDVEKGIKGADIIQEVRNDFGQSVGIIAWESKNTKAWSDSWVEKLKEDRLRVNADVSILVTAVLPKDVEKFGLYKGVWLVEWAYVLPIATMLRGQIEAMAHLRTSLVSKDEKMEVVYNYLTSAKFKDKVENIIDAFRQMQDQVAEERRAFESRWKKREQLLEQVIKNTGGMYGDLGGMLGGKLEKVEYLELGSGL
ncbi:DUF2130 domain-containing protein [Candidatus Gracilibacteria bacterium]|nr:DUF2130 domain-containing protein [Candidatus Gracilibacteria bacterium]